MRITLFLVFGVLLFSACQSPNEKADAANLAFAKRISAKYEAQVKPLLDFGAGRPSEEAIRTLYNQLRNEKGFIGLSITTPYGRHCTANAYSYAFHGEREPLLVDSSRGKEIQYGDYSYTEAKLIDDSLVVVRSSSTNMADHKEVVRDVLKISFVNLSVPFGVTILFQAKSKLVSKFEDGSSGCGSTIMEPTTLLDR